MNNVEIVRKAYECFGRGDIEGLMELYSDDISWEDDAIKALRH